MLLEELVQILDMLEDERAQEGPYKFILNSDGSGGIFSNDDDGVYKWANEEEMIAVVESILEGDLDNEYDF
jgi:hypothetical protein